MKCQVCESTEVIYSGIDAFCYGVPTEKVCYQCAYAFAKVSEINAKIQEQANA